MSLDIIVQTYCRPFDGDFGRDRVACVRDVAAQSKISNFASVVHRDENAPGSQALMVSTSEIGHWLGVCVRTPTINWQQDR